MDERQQPPASKRGRADLPVRVHLSILVVLQLIMGVELVLLFYERLWINAVVVMAITLSPSSNHGFGSLSNATRGCSAREDGRCVAERPVSTGRTPVFAIMGRLNARRACVSET
jgi:hypothetical protein